METLSALLDIYEDNPLVSSGLPMPVMQSFDILYLTSRHVMVIMCLVLQICYMLNFNTSENSLMKWDPGSIAVAWLQLKI